MLEAKDLCHFQHFLTFNLFSGCMMPITVQLAVYFVCRTFVRSFIRFALPSLRRWRLYKQNQDTPQWQLEMAMQVNESPLFYDSYMDTCMEVIHIHFGNFSPDFPKI